MMIDEVFEGMKIFSKYEEIAGGRRTYGVDTSPQQILVWWENGRELIGKEAVEKEIIPEDAERLRKLGWEVEDQWECWSHVVGMADEIWI